MKRTIIYSFILTIIVIVGFFIYESNQFKNYTSTQNINALNEMNIPINKKAPVKSRAEIIIAAPTEQVWQILTNINNWPAWQKDVTESYLKADLGEGVDFKWKAGGLTFTSRIHTMDLRTKFGWTGKTFGASAIHNWFFKNDGDKTIVCVEESLQGVFPSLFKSYFQKNLDQGVNKNLMDLKEASEKNKKSPQ